jgi:hypothetical protein
LIPAERCGRLQTIVSHGSVATPVQSRDNRFREGLVITGRNEVATSTRNNCIGDTSYLERDRGQSMCGCLDSNHTKPLNIPRQISDREDVDIRRSVSSRQRRVITWWQEAQRRVDPCPLRGGFDALAFGAGFNPNCV